MSTALLATTVKIAEQTGSSLVATNILKAQAQVFDEIKVLDALLVHPVSYDTPDNPFFVDYVATEMVESKNLCMDLAHFVGDPFGNTARALRKINPDCKIVVECPAHDLKESIEEWNSTVGFYPYQHMINPYLLNLFNRHTREADLVISPSQFSIDWLKKNFGITKSILIRHGTWIPDYQAPPDEYILGYLGATGPDKGLKYLFGAFNDYKGLTTLKLAGRHIPALSDWKTIITRNNPKAKIELIGWVENKWAYLKDLSVYVHPSVTEGFGITLLEAMATGRAIIASTGAGSAELITDYKEGIKVAPRDVNGLINAIQYFEDNPNEIKKMGEAARETAKKYTWDIIVKEYVKAYEALI